MRISVEEEEGEESMATGLLLLIGSCKYKTCLILSTRSEAVELTKHPSLDVRLEKNFSFEQTRSSLCLLQSTSGAQMEKKTQKLSSHLQNS